MGVKATATYRCCPSPLVDDGKCSYETTTHGEVVNLGDREHPYEADFFPVGEVKPCPRHGSRWMYAGDLEPVLDLA